MKKKVILIIPFVIAVLASVYFFVDKRTASSGTVKNTTSEVDTTPTLMPFADLTIPYLRNLEYNSRLGELEKIGENGEYTSYLTGYTSDNLKINGLLTIPAGEQPVNGWPAIVFVHGYIPPRQYVTTERYVNYVDALAKNGFVVFKIDLRGHGNSEGEPGGGYYSSDYVIDTLNAYSALQSSGFVDPVNIGLWGHSMAGNVVARALAVKPEIKAAVIWAGAGFSYVDLSTYGLSDASYQPQPSDAARMRRRQQIRKLYGDPKDGNPFWKMVAATGYLNELNGAIQLHHAEDDSTVNINYSRDFNAALDLTNVPHEFYEYPNGGHDIEGDSFNPAMQRTVEFYKRNLTD